MQELEINEELKKDDTARLCQLLQSHHEHSLRSDSELQWSWTRCRENMRSKPRATSLSRWVLRVTATCSIAVIGGLLLMTSESPTSDTGDQVVTLREGPTAVAARQALAKQQTPTAATSTDRPNVEYVRSGLWASPFHSSEINADVIWVDGYSYIPAGYPVR